MRSLRGLLPYFRPYRRQIVIGMLSILVGAVIGLATPVLVGSAVDSFRTAPSARTMLLYAGLLVAVAAARGVFTYLQRMVLVNGARRCRGRLRDDLFAQLERLPQSFFHHKTGDLMARATNDLSAVRMLCGPAIMYGTNTIFAGVGSLIFMFGIHPRLALLSLAPMPVVAVVTKVFGQRIHHLFERVQEQFSQLSSRVQENLAGLRVVRAYAREEWEEEQFGAANDEYVARNRVLVLWSSAFYPLLMGLVGLGSWRCSGTAAAGAFDSVTIGQFVTFNSSSASCVADDRHRLGDQPGAARRASFGRIRACWTRCRRSATRSRWSTWSRSPGGWRREG